MRLIIGCVLSMALSANCAFASAPVLDKPKASVKAKQPAGAKSTKIEDDVDIDYGAIVRAEIEKGSRAEPAVSVGQREATLRPPVEIRRDAKARPGRKAIVLPPHRSLKPVEPRAEVIAEVPAGEGLDPVRATPGKIELIDPNSVLDSSQAAVNKQSFELDLSTALRNLR